MSWVKTDNFIPYNDIWYNSGYYNGAITGSNASGKDDGKGRYGANVLDNCVGFANGAFNETFVKNMKISNPNFVEKQYFKFTCNAKEIINAAKDRKRHKAFTENVVDFEVFKRDYILPATYNVIPPVGGLICWGGSQYGHVAYISRVIDKDTIEIMQSGWGTPSWTQVVDGGYRCNTQIVSRNYIKSGKLYENIWWFNSNGSGLNSGRFCQGFIANPAVVIGANDTAIIHSIVQKSPTTICIIGERNSSSPSVHLVKLFYKWNGVVSDSNKDGIIDTTEEKFELTLTKPRGATSVQILPFQVNSNGEMYPGSIVGKDLVGSHSCVYLKDDSGIIREATPYIFTNGEWRMVVPTIREKGYWYELYNTDKERVR